MLQQKNRDDDDPGMFKQLDDIIYIQDYPGYHHFLSNLAQTSMERLCDSKGHPTHFLSSFFIKSMLPS